MDKLWSTNFVHNRNINDISAPMAEVLNFSCQILLSEQNFANIENFKSLILTQIQILEPKQKKTKIMDFGKFRDPTLTFSLTTICRPRSRHHDFPTPTPTIGLDFEFDFHSDFRPKNYPTILISTKILVSGYSREAVVSMSVLGNSSDGGMGPYFEAWSPILHAKLAHWGGAALARCAVPMGIDATKYEFAISYGFGYNGRYELWWQGQRDSAE